MGSFSLIHWFIVLLIVVLIFGTKRLPSIGKDIGSGIKSFKEGMQGEILSAHPPEGGQRESQPEGQSASLRSASQVYGQRTEDSPIPRDEQ